MPAAHPVTDAKQLNENSFIEQTRSGSVLITWKLFRKWLTFGCWQENKRLHCKRESEPVFSSLINSATKQPRTRATNPIADTAAFISLPTQTSGGGNRCLMKPSPILVPSRWMSCLCFDYCSSKIISLLLQAKCVISLGSQIWSKPSEIPLSGVSLHEKKWRKRERERDKNTCSPQQNTRATIMDMECQEDRFLSHYSHWLKG